jgi:hypothetical protein
VLDAGVVSLLELPLSELPVPLLSEVDSFLGDESFGDESFEDESP